MGKDDLFRKRKAKDAKALTRRSPSRASYDKVLIVCEGENTEPRYFEELVDYYELNTANVRISGNCGSSPISVVSYALETYKVEAAKGDPYDRVFCVIDRDAHAGFDEALQKLSKQRPGGVFTSVVSIPCFEYWLLCHFVYTRAGFSNVGKKSAGDLVVQELKRYWPDYTKSLHNIFLPLVDNLDLAKANARRGCEDALANGSSNPSTKVHELVDFLQKLKRN